jgi:hypothetical protein
MSSYLSSNNTDLFSILTVAHKYYSQVYEYYSQVVVVILKRLGCTTILLYPLADETLEGLSDENKDITLCNVVCVLIK